MQLPSSQSSIEEDIGEFLDSLLQDRRVHAKSLVSTFFGDVVAANDGYAWVQTVFAALELLGVNDRLVRTTLFRLREEDWLAATRSGRKSYYQLTELGDSQTRRAERLIYYSDTPDWDGSWTLVFLVVESLDAELRRELEQQLSWIGFGPVTKRVWAHPSSNIEPVAERINRLGLHGKVIAMRCENIQNVELGLDIDDRELAAMCMPVSEVESAYTQFIQDFSPLLDDQGQLTMQGGNAEMLSLRLLMMDEYRRAILRDPHLPMQLLPDNWVGYEAFILCGKIYRQIYQAANVHYQHLQHNAGAVDDSLSTEPTDPSDTPNYAMRFPVEE
jgi:phenylacetic acid degradation operon negative regulatory protein